MVEKYKMLFILAHGFQGDPDDLCNFVDILKKRYKRAKFLIIKSYKDKMNGKI